MCCCFVSVNVYYDNHRPLTLTLTTKKKAPHYLKDNKNKDKTVQIKRSSLASTIKQDKKRSTEREGRKKRETKRQ